MAIIGFNFTKVLAERKKQATGKININNNVTLTSVKETNVVGSVNQKAIEFKFSYNTKYEPEIGNLSLEGSLVFLGNKELVEKALENWEKEEKLIPDLISEVYTYLLEKCSVEGLILAKELNLPPQVPLPKVTAEEKKEMKEERKKKGK